jgi:hypothetical protein
MQKLVETLTATVAMLRRASPLETQTAVLGLDEAL